MPLSERPQMKAVLSKILALHDEMEKEQILKKKECAGKNRSAERRKLTAWQRVELSRKKRPSGREVITLTTLYRFCRIPRRPVFRR